MTFEQVTEVLNALKLPGRIQSGNVILPCPFAAISGHRHERDKHPSLGILPTERGAVFQCFSCKRKGTVRFFVSLLRQMGHDVAEADKLLERYLEVDVDDIADSIPEFEDHAKPLDDAAPIFPETWLLPFKKRVPRYILRRGVTLDTCKAWELGYDRENLRVIYPVRDSKKHLVGAVAGAIQKRSPKYKNLWSKLHKACGNPLRADGDAYRCPFCDEQRVSGNGIVRGFMTSQHLYGENMVLPGDTLVVVEGMVDVLKTWQAVQSVPWPLSVVGLLGSSISEEKADKIVSMTADRRVILFLDNDNAGREGVRSLCKLLSRRLRVFAVDYDLLAPDDDPGKLPAERILELLKEPKVLL